MTAAHHIVAHGNKMAAPAQRVLMRFNIHIDNAANGVFLPDRAASAAPGMYHRNLHTTGYYQAVNQALGNARTRQQALDILDDIRTELLNGTFPR
jgi:hypothetical protein